MDKLYIGIDLGGTNIAAGLVHKNGTLLKKLSIPTPIGSESIISAIESLCLELMDDGVSSVGIGVPGTVWPKGCVSYACNIGMKDIPLAEILSRKLNLPAYVENDANCAALGEYYAGCGKGSSSLLCVTIGTGVGGGFVDNGRLYRGFNGCGVEIGHMVIDPNGEKCACGRRGCFETFASVSALIRNCEKYADNHPHSALAELSSEGIDGKTVFRAMDMGDEGAKEVFENYIRYLACGLTNLVNIFQPEILCIGGGISAQGERLLRPVRDIINNEDYARDVPLRTVITAAKLAGDAGIIGAALLERTEKND